MMLVMCCYQTSLLLLVKGMSVGMLEQQRKERGAAESHLH